MNRGCKTAMASFDSTAMDGRCVAGLLSRLFGTDALSSTRDGSRGPYALRVAQNRRKLPFWASVCFLCRVWRPRKRKPPVTSEARNEETGVPKSNQNLDRRDCPPI
ncbi:uncharacterized protein J3R85_009374 [Psidium guajava]|nr:uncharacterized protein J3R85_009374 [Psidium guajava]